MTACDYKFFPAQAAQTKTLKLQQKKGQSKPSSPSYYNKSLVPTSAFAFITIVRADENKNNSSHSKINLRLISPRLSLEIKTTDHTGRGVYSYGQRLECCPVGFPWDAHRGPLCNPNGKKQKKRQCSPCLQFVKLVYSVRGTPGCPCPCRKYLGCFWQLQKGGGEHLLVHLPPQGNGHGGWNGCNS